MREIKFEYWNDDLKRMYSWEEISHESYPMDISDIEKYNKGIFGKTVFRQFTGLKDKNGRDV